MGDIIHQGGQYSLVNIVLGGHYSLVNNVRGGQLLGGTIFTITPVRVGFSETKVSTIVKLAWLQAQIAFSR